MGSPKRLRAVTAVDEVPRPKPLTVSQAVEWGTTRDVLIALRERIAKAVDEPNIKGADLAALSRRLHEMQKELDARSTESESEGQSQLTADEPFDPETV